MSKTLKKTHFRFTNDEFGKEILLQEDNRKVRMEWEKSYLEACIDMLKPHGDVLEIGYGLGYTAAHIQKYKPKNHIIIESNPEIAEKARKWASKQPANITIITGSWQDELDNLDRFNTIFFDDYVPFGAPEVEQIKLDAATCQKIANQAHKLRDELEVKLKQFSGIKFTDQDLHAFAIQIARRPGITVEYILRFINNLVEMKNITTRQRDDFTKELNSQMSNKPFVETNFQSIFNRIYPIDHFAKFVKICLDEHMLSGARLSAYTGSAESKKNDLIFKDLILSRKDVNYTEKKVSVQVPKNCDYFHGDKALIFAIEKK